MSEYDYIEAMKNDIKDYIENEIDFKDFETLEELEEHLNDELWIYDGVTGNGSGSYTFNTYQAEEYICHNLDLLAEALKEFNCETNALENGAEWCDVTIRCYLLGAAIAEVLEDLEDEFNAAHSKKS